MWQQEDLCLTRRRGETKQVSSTCRRKHCFATGNHGDNCDCDGKGSGNDNITTYSEFCHFNCLQDLLELHQKQNLELRCLLLSSKASSGASTRLDRCLNPRLGQVVLPGVHLPPLGLCLVSHDLPRLRIGQWTLAAFRSLSHNGVV